MGNKSRLEKQGPLLGPGVLLVTDSKPLEISGKIRPQHSLPMPESR
jgi:hypothetical protein